MQKNNNITDTVIHIATSKATQGDENRLVVANDILDRLFIINCFSVSEMTNFVKNELTTILKLTEEETENLLKEYGAKRSIVDDKLKIEKMKKSLSNIKVQDNKPMQMIRKTGIEEICKRIIESNFISNKQLLYKFIIKDLCCHFKLSKQEIQDIQKEVIQWMQEK